jgi:hypothetical protein
MSGLPDGSVDRYRHVNDTESGVRTAAVEPSGPELASMAARSTWQTRPRPSGRPTPCPRSSATSERRGRRRRRGARELLCELLRLDRETGAADGPAGFLSDHDPP